MLTSMDDIYNNIEENNQNKKRKILTAFDDIIVDIKYNDIISHENQSQSQIFCELLQLRDVPGTKLWDVLGTFQGHPRDVGQR